MRRFLLMIWTLACSLHIMYAQGLEMGLRDNQFARIGYLSKVGVLAGYEQSLLNVKMKEQSGRLYGGYAYGREALSAAAVLYYGTEYARSWQNMGVLMTGSYGWNRFCIGGSLNPHYDTSLDFQFCYQVLAGFSLWEKKTPVGSDEVGLRLSYGNIPEYRMAVNSLRLGLRLTSGNLWVQPMLSLPNIDKNNGGKNIRVLCSFGYRY